VWSFELPAAHEASAIEATQGDDIIRRRSNMSYKFLVLDSK